MITITYQGIPHAIAPFYQPSNGLVPCHDLLYCIYSLVGILWEDVFNVLPSDVVPACHIAVQTVTISGPKKRVEEVVAQLTKEGKFAREVNSSGVAFHSYMLQPCANGLRDALSKVSVAFNIYRCSYLN